MLFLEPDEIGERKGWVKAKAGLHTYLVKLRIIGVCLREKIISTQCFSPKKTGEGGGDKISI